MIEKGELIVLLEEFLYAMKNSILICIVYPLILAIFEKKRKVIKKFMSIFVALFTFYAAILDHFYQCGIFENMTNPYHVLVFCAVIGMVHAVIE